jgi:exonuclease III
MATQVLQFNANGLSSRFRELKNFLSSNSFDIVLIQETFLKPGRYLKFPGFTQIRKDRENTPKGGLLTLVKEGLKFAEIECQTSLEYQAIKVYNGKVETTVINLYISPSKDFKESDLEPLFQLSQNILICGDFNAHSTLWNASYLDKRGETIENLLSKNNLVMLNTGSPTFQNWKGELSHIDLSIASPSLAAKTNWFTNNTCFGSDHHPITIQINFPFDSEMDFIPKWKLEKADWKMFATLCSNNIMSDSFSCFSSTEEKIEAFTSCIIEAADAAIPSTKPYKGRKKFLPFWNEKIKKALYCRNIARNKLNRSKSLHDAVVYKKHKSLAQKTIREEAQDYWQSFCSGLAPSSKLSPIWKMAKRMNGNQDKPSSKSLLSDGKTLVSNIDKANAFAKYFSDINSNKNHTDKFLAHRTDIENNHPETFQNDVPLTDESSPLNKNFTLYELETAINGLKNHSAPGEDSIMYEMFKNLPNCSRRVLLKCYNEIWNRGFMPSSWKHAIVLPFLKSGKDPACIESYRPISLTPTICKLMERLITDRLTWFLEHNGFLHNSQSGFRRNRSVIDHILRLQDQINKALKNKYHTLGVFLDFEKAFDLIWHNGLYIKLKNIGINGKLFEWIKDFLTNRTLQVRVGTQISDRFVLENGTAQGAIISPILFVPKLSFHELLIHFAGRQTTSSVLWRRGKRLRYETVRSIQLNELSSPSINKFKNKSKLNTKQKPIVLFSFFLHIFSVYYLFIFGLDSIVSQLASLVSTTIPHYIESYVVVSH